MSLFIVNTPDYEGQLRENLIATHKSKPLLATAWTNPPSVLITTNEGTVLTSVKEPAGSTGRMQQPTSLAWHPTESLLVIGWSNGKMSLWTMPSASSLALGDDAAAAPMSTAVLLLAARAATQSDAEGAVREHGAGTVLATEWSTRGLYLVSTSQQRLVVVWMLDQTATESSITFKLKPLWFVQTPDPIVRVIHVPSNDPRSAPGAADAFNDSAADAGMGDDDINFLLAGGGATISAVNEEQQLFSCVTQQEPIVSVLYDPRRRTLITLSASYMIEGYRVGEDIVGSSIVRRKLPAPTGTKIATSMAWASPGVVVFGGGDDKLRLFELATESLDVVSLPQSGLHVSCVATMQAKGVMAAGTVEGTLAVFQRTAAATAAAAGVARGADRPAAAAADGHANHNAGSLFSIGGEGNSLGGQWEALAVHHVGKYVDRVVFTALGDMALCRSGTELQVLHETNRKRAWDGVAAATQISADMVVIESVTGCQCLLRSKGNVRELSIAFPNIALWNGSQIDLYAINEATSEFTLVNFVPTTSRAFAMHRDGLIYVKGNRVVYETLQLSPIAQMTFTEPEGVPVIMDIMNDYLVVVSSKNVLRLAKVSSRDLRQMGPSRPLTFPSAMSDVVGGAASTASAPQPPSASASPVVSIGAARVNAQGRRVAFMTKLGGLGLPDTRVWVYDSDTDKMSSFDFAAQNEMPNAVYWNTPEPNTSSVGELEYLLLACETHQMHGEDAKAPSDDSMAGNKSDADPNRSKSTDHPGNQEDLPEALPDMENFAERKDSAEENRRGALGATNYIGKRAHNIVTLFATHTGLVVQNVASLRRYQICLVGLTIPDFLLASVKINGNPSNAEDYVIEQKRLRDFEGLKSDKDVAVREALMKFSYYSTVGNMDEAYRCVKNIKNPAAWQGLARLCVTSGRLDVAAVCLATMEDCVAARALREAREEYPDEKDVQVATLALGLGMTDECEALLRKAKRFDLMTDVFMACGKFEHAQRHSERFDRIRIRPVAYKYAQFMESLQNMDAAIMWYYNAKCAGTDVPRIFFQTNRMNELRDYMVPRAISTQGSNVGSPVANGAKSSNGSAQPSPSPPREDPHAAFATLFPRNRELLLWWAEHSERRRNAPEALRFYTAGEDVYNVVRILCSFNPPKLDAAVDLVQKEMDKAKVRFQQQQAFAAAAPGRRGDEDVGEPDPVGAAFFVGQVLERQGDVARALQYYQSACAYRSGCRVAWKAEQYGMVVSLAMKSGDGRLMLETAMALERQQVFDKAVQLYRRLGAVQCALDACVKGSLFDTLHEVSANLANASTDPAVFLGMADHFQSEGDYQKAVEMLVFAKHFDEAMKLCETRNVTLTEEMAESITSDLSKLSQEEKQALLHKVAHIARDQGNWSLACKEYTLANDRVKAMKMLIRGGETEKAIFFANHSRNAEIYTMAANFLQLQNWSTDANIYKSIVLFYTKAKAFASLMTFYESCAQLQIDEHRSYPEALRALEDCIRMTETSPASKANLDALKIESIKHRIEVLRGFVKAQEVVNSMNVDDRGSPEEKAKADSVIASCSDIIKRSRPASPDHDLIQEALRIGDVFALMVRFYFDKLGESNNALKVMESMSKHGAEPQFYIEVDYMDKVCRANGKSLDIVLPNARSAAVGSASAAGVAAEAGRKPSTDTRRSSVLDEVDNAL